MFLFLVPRIVGSPVIVPSLEYSSSTNFENTNVSGSITVSRNRLTGQPTEIVITFQPTRQNPEFPVTNAQRTITISIPEGTGTFARNAYVNSDGQAVPAASIRIYSDSAHSTGPQIPESLLPALRNQGFTSLESLLPALRNQGFTSLESQFTALRNQGYTSLFGSALGQPPLGTGNSEYQGLLQIPIIQSLSRYGVDSHHFLNSLPNSRPRPNH